MAPYIDGFVLPIARDQLDDYASVVEQVAQIWLEHGALAYAEFVRDGAELEGTRSFASAAAASPEEVVIFGWVSFESRAARDRANELVLADPRMEALIAPLLGGPTPTFDAERMVYGGFRALVSTDRERAEP